MLNSINCSTVIRLPTVILMLLREATGETYGPRVYLPSYKFPIYLILQSLLSNLYHENTKNIYHILLSLSDLTLVSDREGIDIPLSRWLRGVICFVQVLGDARATSYWIDTLVLKN